MSTSFILYLLPIIIIGNISYAGENFLETQRYPELTSFLKADPLEEIKVSAEALELSRRSFTASNRTISTEADLDQMLTEIVNDQITKIKKCSQEFSVEKLKKASEEVLDNLSIDPNIFDGFNIYKEVKENSNPGCFKRIFCCKHKSQFQNLYCSPHKPWVKTLFTMLYFDKFSKQFEQKITREKENETTLSLLTEVENFKLRQEMTLIQYFSRLNKTYEKNREHQRGFFSGIGITLSGLGLSYLIIYGLGS